MKTCPPAKFGFHLFGISIYFLVLLVAADFSLGQLAPKGRDYAIENFEAVDKTAFEVLWALNLKLKSAHGVLQPIYITGNCHPTGRAIRLYDILSRDERMTIRLKSTTFWTAFNTIISKKGWHWSYGDSGRIIVYPWARPDKEEKAAREPENGQNPPPPDVGGSGLDSQRVADEVELLRYSAPIEDGQTSIQHEKTTDEQPDGLPK